MHTMNDLFPINIKRYDAAVDRVRKSLGSYEAIAAQLYSHTDKPISGNAVRRWLLERKIPIEYAAIFSDLTFQDVVVTDFYPWLKKYTS